jgi:putative redox protein
MVSIEIEYDGELRCEAEHGPSGARITTDAPEDNHGRGEAFSPTDLVATGLGTCVATILGIEAEKGGLDLGDLRVTVDKHMTEDGPRRIDRLETHVYCSETFDERVQRRLEAAGRGCPVHRSLRAEVDAPITFHWGGGEKG